MDQFLGVFGSLALLRQLLLEKENFEFKPVVLHLDINLVLLPAYCREVW